MGIRIPTVIRMRAATDIHTNMVMGIRMRMGTLTRMATGIHIVMETITAMVIMCTTMTMQTGFGLGSIRNG